MVDAFRPVIVNGLVAAVTVVPAPWVKPTTPYSISHEVAPPEVQDKVTEFAVEAVALKELGTGQATHNTEPL